MQIIITLLNKKSIVTNEGVMAYSNMGIKHQVNRFLHEQKNHISVPPPDENNIMQQFAKQNTGQSLILTASQ